MPRQTISPDQLGFDFVEFHTPTDLSGLDMETDDKSDDKNPRVQYIIRNNVQHTEYPDKPCPCMETWVGEHSGLTHCVLCYPPRTTRNEWLERYTLGAEPQTDAALAVILAQEFFVHIGVLNEFERSRSGSTFPKVDPIGEASVEGTLRHVEALDDIETKVASRELEASGADSGAGDSRSNLDEPVGELGIDNRGSDFGEREMAMLRAFGQRDILGREG